MATPTQFEVLEAVIDSRLLTNNPRKYAAMKAAGTLRPWLRSQAKQAWHAMESLGPEANDD